MARIDPQAETAAKLFGGWPQLAQAAGRTPATTYRWGYPKARGGTNGLIPLNARAKISKAAKRRSRDFQRKLARLWA